MKITKFLGIAPRLADELLPDTVAQVANNCKLYSGNLLPYPEPVVAYDSGATLGALGVTIHTIRGGEGEFAWLAITGEANIVSGVAGNPDEGRTYYTDTSTIPKVTNYRLATLFNTPPYPDRSYYLGVPLPEDQPIADFRKTSTVGTNFYERESNRATITTVDPHNFITGNFVNVEGFTGLTGTYIVSEIAGEYTITFTSDSPHGYSSSTTLFIEITSGNAISRAYTITVTNDTVFTSPAVGVTAATSGAFVEGGQSFNANNVEIEVESDIKISYFSPGDDRSNTLDRRGEVSLAGNTQARSYTYTHITGWEEESIGAEPSEEIFLTEGEAVVISNLPTTNPYNDTVYNVRGIDLYRTVSTANRADYFKLDRLWFPLEVTYVLKALEFNPFIEITTEFEHGLRVGNIVRFISDEVFLEDIEVEVVSIISDFTFGISRGYAVTFDGVPSNTTVYRGARETSSSQVQYFGLYDTAVTCTITAGSEGEMTITDIAYVHTHVANDLIYLHIPTGDNITIPETGVYRVTSVTASSITVRVSEDFPADTFSASLNTNPDADNPGIFIDTYRSTRLIDILTSDDYDPPPSGLKGLVSVQDNILAGFVGNRIYFSEPGQPHAWPEKYAINLESNIVAIAPVAGYVLVMTDSYPYQFTGSNPGTMAFAKIDTLYPCVSSRGVVNMGYGVIYPTYGGLALYSPSSGGILITKLVEDWDTWETRIDYTNLTASFFDDKYIATDGTTTIIFERNDEVGGLLTTTDIDAKDFYYDGVTGKLFFYTGTSGDIAEFNNLAQPNGTYRWKSKVIEAQTPINLGAARIVADYAPPTVTWDTADIEWENACNIWDSCNPITFRLWAGKKLVFTKAVFNSNVFRLPTGYRLDEVEVEVEANIRIRSIRMAETPLGLNRD